MSSHNKSLLVVIATLLVAISWQLSSAQEGDRKIIKVRGSDSMSGLVDSYAKEFMKSHPEVHIVVSGGQDIAFDALANKDADIIMASREIHPTEREAATKKGVDIQGKVVGWGGIVIIVNPQNPTNELTVEQVRRLFEGQSANWKDVGGPNEPVSVLTVGEERGGTLDFVRHHFLKAPFASNAVTKMYFRSVIADVAETQPDIGFVRVRNILQLTAQGLEKKVKVIAIRKDEKSPAILPSRETCNNGTYPISRPYFLYIDQKSADKLIKEFFDFCVAKNPRPL